MKRGLVVAALLSIGVAAFLTWVYTSEFTDCFAHFDSPEAAERAASVARAAGFDTDVEEGGPESRRPSSPGAREISVTFSDGETGEDAEVFRTIFRRVVEQENGGFGHPGGGCLERHMLD